MWQSRRGQSRGGTQAVICLDYYGIHSVQVQHVVRLQQRYSWENWTWEMESRAEFKMKMWEEQHAFTSSQTQRELLQKSDFTDGKWCRLMHTRTVHHSIISLFYVFVWLLVEKETVKVFFFLGKFFGASFVISLNEVDTDCRYLIDIQFAR